MKPLLIKGKYYIECDIYMLPIDISKNDPNDCIGKLFLNENNVLTRLSDLDDIIKSNGYFNAIPQDLYVVCNEKPKPGNWCYNGESVLQCSRITNIVIDTSGLWSTLKDCKKIISATNKSFTYVKANTNYEVLPLPQIPNAFIDYYMVNYKKGNKIQKVLVEVSPPLYDGTEATAKLNYRLKLNEDGFITILTQTNALPFLATELRDYVNKKHTQEECIVDLLMALKERVI